MPKDKFKKEGTLTATLKVCKDKRTDKRLTDLSQAAGGTKTCSSHLLKYLPVAATHSGWVTPEASRGREAARQRWVRAAPATSGSRSSGSLSEPPSPCAEAPLRFPELHISPRALSHVRGAPLPSPAGQRAGAGPTHWCPAPIRAIALINSRLLSNCVFPSLHAAGEATPSFGKSTATDQVRT